MRVEIPNEITVTLGGLISRGVKAAEITDAGVLVFTLTDGSKLELGSVVGPEGPKGAKGDTGAAGKDGANGITPTIGANGNWYLGEADTGKPSRGEKGDRGERGAKGDAGERGAGFVVSGYYESADALRQAVTSPAAGDAYGVGTEEPYDIYIYDGVTKTWINNGPLQGAKGAKGDKGDQGADGAPGAAGKDGTNGTNGITPTIGTNGNWYLGDTDTGKPSRGAKGDKGDKGDQGEQGLPGSVGSAGPRGPKGDPGDTGATGTTYTPAVSSTGVISWTNDGGKTNPTSVDLVSAVLAALPTWTGGTY